MFYLTRYVSLFLRFVVMDGTVTRCFGAGFLRLAAKLALRAQTVCGEAAQGKKVSAPNARGRFVYLQFTEVLVFSMICVLFYDT